MPCEATIRAFAQALDDPARPAPLQTQGREGRPDIRRFAVYRNNVAVGLIAALAARYPVVARLVGEDFFRAAARAFIRDHKPRTAVILHYGDEFPGFLEDFAPVRDLPYLADVARLENAWVESYHAAEAAPIGLEALGAIDPERIGETAFRFHPSARLLKFAHPAASIWAGHQGPGEPRAPEVWGPESALIVRPDADVVVRALPSGGYEFAAALLSGATLAEAAEAVAEDPGSHLVGLIEAGAITHVL
jgi:hypothetical protein